jgi:RNA polymerase sigma-70 factor, ECF subfamily
MMNTQALLNLEALTDTELVTLSQQGDNHAFAELIGRHYTSCLKLALSILRDKSDAEDEVQNACWKAYEHLKNFQGDSKFSTWLTRIVVNQCLMKLRKLKRAKFLYIDDAVVGEEIQTLELPDNSESPEELLSQAQVTEVVQAEIRRIPPLLRNVFLLRDVEELPMPDVAERLGISVAAAKSRLLRARLELRERVSKYQLVSNPLPEA